MRSPATKLTSACSWASSSSRSFAWSQAPSPRAGTRRSSPPSRTPRRRTRKLHKLTVFWKEPHLKRVSKFLIRIVGGFIAGILLGVVQLGWDERTWPIVLEYGLVLGSMAFAVTNYLEFRQRLLARVLRETRSEERRVGE